MKTSIVYCVVSEDKDIYLEQTLVSAYSLRLHNPDAHVLLVVDQFTNKNIKGKRAEILKYISEKVVVDVPTEYNKKERSRYLKTTLRKYIKGDYLFIDSDTIICDSLDETDNFPYDIGAVKDRHLFLKCNPFKDMILFHMKKVKYRPSNEDIPYYNSGVFFVRDNKNAHSLYDKWHQYWKEGMDEGLDIDQPALAKADSALCHVIHEMDGSWNCQILAGGLQFLIPSRIIHYYSSNLPSRLSKPTYFFFDKSVFYEIKDTGKLSEKIIYQIDNAKKAFSSNYVILPGIYWNFIHSYQYRILQKIYFSHKRIYHLIEVLFGLIIKPYYKN